MADVIRQTGGTDPEDRNSVTAAQRHWTTVLVEETTKAHREAVERIVAESAAIQDEQSLIYCAPFVEDAIRMMGRHMLSQQNDSITRIEEIAKDYLRRRGL